MRPVSDAQVRRLMEELSKSGRIGKAAMRSDMDRKTARKYIQEGKLPSELKQPRDWRTRSDPFAEHWGELEAKLVEAPELEAKTLFAWLSDRYPGRYQPGQLRTLQRHIRSWRASHGPDKRVFFAQRHRPGECAQTDFTHATELKVTILGQLFVHLLCNFVLPFSNWQWATVCLSESIAALRRGVQRALFRLGRRPQFHQTDHSTGATHRIGIARGDVAAATSDPGRAFNEEYLAVMRHLGMTPRTTAIGAKEQNGDVESSNGALKRRLEQALLLRGSRDFESVEAWQQFVDDTLDAANHSRANAVAQELAAMRLLDVSRLPEFTEEWVRVCEWSTIRVKNNAYSVPSRLIGEEVKVQLYEERLDIFYADELQLSCERLRGKQRHRIDYRHLIGSLVRRPGAFARYVYREELFPTVVFRRAYDALQTPYRGTHGDLEYLRVLQLAATTMESQVEEVLSRRLAAGQALSYEEVRGEVSGREPDEVPQLLPLAVDLSSYDALIGEVGT